jgi:hypothetical protein
MADTLEEIYEGTLQESDFNSSGEATIVTTNTTTRHVIKDVNVKQGDADIPIGGNLDINGYNIADLTRSSQGSAIMGTSNTLKVKTNDFPLTYEDLTLQIHHPSTTIKTFDQPRVNGVSGRSSTAITDVDVSGFDNLTEDQNSRQFWTNIGPSNNVVQVFKNTNNTHKSYVLNSSGTQIYSHTTDYEVKWFDGTQYLYYMSSPNLYRVDTHSASPSASVYIQAPSSTTLSSYPNLFGLKDKYVIAWAQQGEYPFLFDFANNSSRVISTATATNTFTSNTKSFYLIEKTNGDTVIVKPVSASVIHYWDFSPATTSFDTNASSNYNQINLSENFKSYPASHAVIGSKLYYVTSGNDVAFVDFENDTQFVDSNVTLPTNFVGTNSYGPDIWGTLTTPSSSDISARTYTMSPSIGVRLTGVTSA